MSTRLKNTKINTNSSQNDSDKIKSTTPKTAHFRKIYNLLFIIYTTYLFKNNLLRYNVYKH
jgi:hypothetical protein